MGAYPLIPVTTENQLWAEIETRRIQRRVLESSVTPRMAGIASGISQSYPWLQPGVVQSMTQANLAANTPQAYAIAVAAAAAANEDGAFEPPAPDIPQGWFDKFMEFVGGTIPGRAAVTGVRGVVALLAAPFEEVFEAGAPAFHAAEEATDPLLPMSDLGDNMLANALEMPYDFAVSASRLFQGEFWGTFWDKYVGTDNDFLAQSGGEAAPSTLRLAIQDIARGDAPKLFGFSDDPEDQEGLIANFARRQEYRAQIQLPGHGGTSTLGRAIALDVFEPGSKAYEAFSGVVDIGANFLPVGLGIGRVARAAGFMTDAQRIAMGGRAGLLPGITKRVDMDTAINSYISSPVGQRLVGWLTDTTDQGTIYNRIKDVKLSRDFAQATDNQTVINILRGLEDLPEGMAPRGLGLGALREVPTAGLGGRAIGSMLGEYGALFGPGAKVQQALRNTRFVHEVPGKNLNPHDINGAARIVHDWVRNNKMGDEALNKYLDRLANMDPGDDVAMWNLTFDFGEDLFHKLVNQEQTGIPGLGRPSFTKGEAQRLVHRYRNTYDEARAYFIDYLGRDADILGAGKLVNNGEELSLPSVHLTSELVSGVIPMPGNALDLKRATSFVGRVWNIPGVKGTVGFADDVLSKVWKPAQLVTRIAYPIRVLAEEQVRLAGTGMDSLLSHPLSYIQWMIASPQGKFANAFSEGLQAVGVKPRGETALGFQLFDELNEFQSAMARGAAGWKGMPGDVLSGRFARVPKGHEDHLRGAATELGQLAADPVAMRLAGGLQDADFKSIGLVDAEARAVPTIEVVKEWFYAGSGRQFREQLGRVKGKEDLAGDSARAKEAADSYVDSVMERINIKTGQHPDLLQAIATGKLGGDDLRQLGPTKVPKTLEEYIDSLPEFTKVEILDAGHTGRLDRVTTAMFSFLMSHPTNSLSRSPFFRQVYWKETERLMGYATRDVHVDVIKFAREANLGRDAEANLATIATKTSGDRIQSWDEIDTLAKSFALDQTKDMLYDLTKRNQAFETLRHVFPFGDAWKEIITAWSKILVENPSMLRRFQQTAQGALGPGFGEMSSEFLGTGTQAGQGFLFTDPTTNELMFNYPGSELVSRALLGTDKAQVGFGGLATGLNLFGASVLPGIGVSIQLPVKLFGDVTGYQLPKGLNDIIFPYGSPELEEGIVEEMLLPAWMQKIRTAAIGDPETQRLYMNTVADVMRALVRGGGYKSDTPEHQQELLEAATSRARALFWIRGIAQSTVPTGPSLRWSTEDAQGNLVPIKLLSDEYRRLVTAHGGDVDAALGEWIAIFGTENLLALQGKTKEVIYRPLNEEGAGWIAANPDLEKDHSNVIGFFAPDPIDGTFDYNAYIETVNEGFRQTVSPREQLHLANDFLGNLAYQHAKSQLGDRDDSEAAAWLAQVKEILRNEYPGYDDQLPIKPSPKPEELIPQLEAAASDPRLADSDVATAIREYTIARTAAQQMVDNNRAKLNNSSGYGSSDSTRFLRDWLRTVGAELTAKYPGFQEVWQRVYSRELKRDEVEQ